MSEYALCIDGPLARKLILVSPRNTNTVDFITTSVSNNALHEDTDIVTSTKNVKKVTYFKIPLAGFVYPNSGIDVSLMTINEHATIQDAVRIMARDFALNEIVSMYEHS